MLDLVGNPEDRFSHNEAQMTTAILKSVVGRNGCRKDFMTNLNEGMEGTNSQKLG